MQLAILRIQEALHNLVVEFKNDSVGFDQLYDVFEDLNFRCRVFTFSHNLFKAFLDEVVEKLLSKNQQTYFVVVKGVLLGVVSVENSAGQPFKYKRGFSFFLARRLDFCRTSSSRLVPAFA